MNNYLRKLKEKYANSTYSQVKAARHEVEFELSVLKHSDVKTHRVCQNIRNLQAEVAYLMSLATILKEKELEKENKNRIYSYVMYELSLFGIDNEELGRRLAANLKLRSINVGTNRLAWWKFNPKKPFKSIRTKVRRVLYTIANKL